jgi:5-methyltetrahydrofolate--homocysteine methyltransferase
MEEEKAKALKDGSSALPSNAGVVVLATVKGDVHDIGKNIVGVVLGCNNFKVIDLGVMVSCEKILKAAIDEKADVIGLSGLITPSLDEMVFVAKEMERKGMKIPLLIGGATTSRMHTAVKVAPQYSQPVVHVLDASRSVVVVSTLIDKNNKDDYSSEIREDYEQLRKEHYASLEEKKLLTLEKARAKQYVVDWINEPAPVKPTFLGTKVYKEYPLGELLAYIDWKPFFDVWSLRGKYPNKGYPKIFNDATVGKVAKKTFDEAQELLKEIVSKKLLTARAVVGFYAANSEGDDIVLFENDDRQKEATRLFTLRQQSQKEDLDARYLALSDFIAPKSTKVKDYIGMFACSAGFGLDKIVAEAKQKNDDYRALMASALADRLAEALAEKMHETIRRTLWGYSKEESLSASDMLNVKYQGIRPAPGYPSQPDHTEKKTMWKLMDITKESGIELSDQLAMIPGASVSALVFASKHSQYFGIDKVQKDQIVDYAKRKNLSVEQVETQYALSLLPVLSLFLPCLWSALYFLFCLCLLCRFSRDVLESPLCHIFYYDNLGADLRVYKKLKAVRLVVWNWPRSSGSLSSAPSLITFKHSFILLCPSILLAAFVPFVSSMPSLPSFVFPVLFLLTGLVVPRYCF